MNAYGLRNRKYYSWFFIFQVKFIFVTVYIWQNNTFPINRLFRDNLTMQSVGGGCGTKKIILTPKLVSNAITNTIIN